MAFRKSARTYSSSPLDGHQVDWYFETNGTSDPTVFSGNIESVTREDDASGTPFYRVTLAEAFPFDCIEGEHVGITNLDGDRLIASRYTDLQADPGAVDPTEGLQFDIVVCSLLETADAIDGETNSTAAGRRVSGYLLANVAG